ncbi:aldehyde dehydrogenase family protein [Paenibacillus elgii]|uniref:aldehyde dehydrogenase family protein n=1 Tax=Paenibacillus elgii TaxID=189691 RepID=UPI002D7DC752|nr:aldehyde dehydrogenase family protein [Paenibacillus elgii]
MKKHLLINSEWISTDSYVTLYSPYTKKVIGEIASADTNDVNKAIEAAANARSVMRRMAAHQRAGILENLASLLQLRREEAARLIALEAAKPIKTALAEVDRTIHTYKFAAEEAKRIHGETIPLDAAPGGENRVAYTIREPIGIIGAITPFNFPMNLVAHKVGPAIATGNTIVLKPAEQTPLSALFLGELLMEAGLPAGALNIVTGKGRVIGDAIVTDPRVSMVTFTGSPEVGISIRSKAGLKRVTLELGSNAAVIIDDNVDIDPIVERCVTGAFSFQGQVCISLQRIYVVGDKYEEFTAKFIQASQKLKLGNPLDPETDVSAMITQKDTQRALDWIQEAKNQGAEVASGGSVTEDGVLQPTVLLHVSPQSSVSCKEVFAPIVLINKARSVEEAVSFVNDSNFGLQAGIYTKDIHTAQEAITQLHVGGVIINDIPTFRVDHMPYGGVKQSGMGREGIKYAVEEMTEMKLVVFNLN